MRSILLFVIFAAAVAVAAYEVIIRNFLGGARLPEETAPARQVVAPVQVTTTFRGPVGEPKIIGPKAPPPNY